MELAQDCAQRRALLDVYSVDAVLGKRYEVESVPIRKTCQHRAACCLIQFH